MNIWDEPPEAWKSPKYCCWEGLLTLNLPDVRVTSWSRSKCDVMLNFLKVTLMGHEYYVILDEEFNDVICVTSLCDTPSNFAILQCIALKIARNRFSASNYQISRFLKYFDMT